MFHRAVSAAVIAGVLMSTGVSAIGLTGDPAVAVVEAVQSAEALPVSTPEARTDWCTANPNSYVTLQQLTSNPSVGSTTPARANISLWLQRVNRNEGQASPAGIASRATLDTGFDGVGYRALISDLQLTASLPSGWPAGSYISDTGNTQGVNALGLSDDGVVYLVYQYMAYRAWTGGTPYHFFADVFSIDLKDPNAAPVRVAQHYALDQQTTTGFFPIVSAGAVNPVDGDFYFGEQSVIAQGADAGKVVLTIHRLDTDSGEIGAVAESQLSAPTATALGLLSSTAGQESASNTRLAGGDFDFNGRGDLTYVVHGDPMTLLPTIPAEQFTQVQSGTVAAIPETQLLVPRRTDGSLATHGLHRIEGMAQLDNGLGVFADRQTGATGTATATSRHFLRSANNWVYANQPLNGRDYTFTPGSSLDASSGIRDLASCSTRAPITIELDTSRVTLADGESVVVTVDGEDSRSDGTWVIDQADASQQTSLMRMLATAAQASSTTVRVALSSGEPLGVRHTCTNHALAPNVAFYNFATGATESGQFTMRVPDAATQTTQVTNWGYTPQITCTLTPFRPALTVDQSVVNASTDEAVAAGEPLQAARAYRIDTSFGNVDGEATTQVDHVLWLTDLCDDVRTEGSANLWLAELCAGSSTAIPPSSMTLPPGFTADPVPGGVRVRGSIPAGGLPSDHTVRFDVQVLANAEAAESRQGEGSSGQRGYTLRTFVTTHVADAEPPAECTFDASRRTACTDHPVLAWTVEKGAQLEDGASVRTGDHIHYTLTVTKRGVLDHEVGGIRLQDDMTEVLRVARMEPDAPTFDRLQTVGIRTYGAENTTPLRTLTPGAGLPDDALLPHSAAASASPEAPTWTMRVPEFDLLPGEHRAVVTYAVRVGGAADPADPTQFRQEGEGHAVALVPGLFTNTVVATATDSFPISCDPRATDSVTTACSVTHRLSDTSFHVQKNSSRSVGGDAQGILAAEFVLADADADADQGQWSRWICRDDNLVEADGTQAAPAGTQSGNAGVQPGIEPRGESPYSGEEILHSIRAWNSALPEGDPLRKAECGLFYPHAVDADASASTWHGEAVAPGPYLLWETQASPGHQQLVEPVAFTVGALDPGPEGLSPDDADLYSYEGRVSLDSDDSGWFTGDGRQIALTCEATGGPGSAPSTGAPACVMSTGRLVHIYSPTTLWLPLSGAASQWSWAAAATGLAVVIGLVWWRRHRRMDSAVVE